ncbi:hypothetical protein CMI37_15030 [Candidatus Pacearchaeota archaeon]|nr:hypothetical protein [Candidatus Pacearchaeota archaeon]
MANIIEGKDNINMFRLITMKHALKLEIDGMTRRGRSVYSIIKDEFKLKGSKKKVLEQFSNIIDERKKGDNK